MLAGQAPVHCLECLQRQGSPHSSSKHIIFRKVPAKVPGNRELHLQGLLRNELETLGSAGQPARSGQSSSAAVALTQILSSFLECRISGHQDHVHNLRSLIWTCVFQGRNGCVMRDAKHWLVVGLLVVLAAAKLKHNRSQEQTQQQAIQFL